ncbi:hypothetical protein C496_14386 [Natronorubrum tibetense GA33]|uniref:Uncharacterized protein n=1 Tax=Natronorubrum tibetense GA33 TaxID=1114856 RepID=L9VUC6_9EURY|nr:hypothetical protein C496_14386 [Natronorubrum tibetense GA33]
MEARISVVIGEACSLPRTVPAKQLKIIDCLGQVRKSAGVVVTSDSDEGNTSLRERGRHGLNGTERLGVLVFAVNEVTRNDDRVHSPSNSCFRDISPDRPGRKVGRIESVGKSARTASDMNIRCTQNLY